MSTTPGAYLLRPISKPQATHRLVCLPWAGAGPGVYNQWARELPAEVDLITVVLPGRAERRHEAPAHTVDLMAEQIALELLVTYGEVEWLALIGHSLGALIAFDVATRLRCHDTSLDGVIVSGSRAAHVDPPVELHELPDYDLVDALIELGGLNPDLRYDAAFLRRVLPRVRADLTASELYRPSPNVAHLAEGCRLHAWAGVTDWYAPPTVVQAWSELAADTQPRTFDGDHFFIKDLSVRTVLAALGWPHDTVQPSPTTLERAA